jgi:pimeloyl-ACP methyl ester carboxylesterase
MGAARALRAEGRYNMAPLRLHQHAERGRVPGRLRALPRSRPRKLGAGWVLANFTPGHQDTYVDFKNDDRAPLLFIAGGKDDILPPSVNEFNVHHYRKSSAGTDHKEFPGRSHFTVGQEGWEEVADHALDWAKEHAALSARRAD